MNAQAPYQKKLRSEFKKAACNKEPGKRRTHAFALRFTDAERAYLEQKAGALPLGTYIHKQILGEHEEKRLVLRRPKVNDEKLALVLAELGQSRLASNVNQLAKSANMGTLDVSRDIEQELQDAADAILEMRKALMIALGLKP